MIKFNYFDYYYVVYFFPSEIHVTHVFLFDGQSHLLDEPGVGNFVRLVATKIDCMHSPCKIPWTCETRINVCKNVLKYLKIY